VLLLALLQAAAAAAGPAPSGGAPGPEQPRVVDLTGGWLYRWGDSPPGPDGAPAWAAGGGTGEGWSPVEALATPPGRNGADFLWLSLPLPQGPWRERGVLLGAVGSAFEAYVGGRKVHASGELVPGGTERAHSNGWALLRVGPPEAGGRLLLRVQSSTRAIGVRQEARMGDYDALVLEALRANLVPLLMGALLGVLGLLAFAAFALRRDQRLLGHLGTFMTYSGVLLASMSGVPQLLTGASLPWHVAMNVGCFLLVPGLGGFVGETLSASRARGFRTLVRAVYVFAAALILVALLDGSRLGGAMQLFTVVALGFLGLCVALPVLELRGGSADARLLVAGLGAFFLAGVVAGLGSMGILPRSGQVMPWGFLALTGSLVGIVGRRLWQMARQLRAHAAALEAGRDAVHRLAERLGQGAAELGGVAQQLRTTSAEQNAGVTRQAASLQQAQATVEEIRQTSRLTADKARALADAAGGAEQVGREGQAALEQTLAGLQAVGEEVAETASRLTQLDARTREIGNVIDSVKALADQSNMLALNAAIEATRAGEHGKGFGVVAREVRHLADQSLKATHRVRAILEGLGSGMREAAELSARGQQRVGASLEAVRASGARLQRLAEVVAETGDSMRQISAAVVQQDAGTSQIATAVAELSAQMAHTLEALEQTDAVVDRVQQLAAGMAATAAGGPRAPAARP
jgi:methyl-accepting chemotaxis protein